MNFYSIYKGYGPIEKMLCLIALFALLFGVISGIAYTSTAHANNGLVVSAIPNSGVLALGDSLEVRIEDPSETTSATSSSCLVNNKDVTETLENISAGLYKFSYMVEEGDQERASGEIPIECTLSELNTITVTAFDDGNTVSISFGASTSTSDDVSTSTDDTTDSATTTTSIATSTGQVEGEVIGGIDEDNGILALVSIEQMRDTALAGGTYEEGWAWKFHITVPSNEPNLQLKFGDWSHSSATSTILVSDNMRISSLQAISTSTVTIISAGEYSAPLVISGDLDLEEDGMQIEVIVEAKVPSGALNGSYATSYGIQSSD